jgi:hypothetical protein
MKVKFTFIALLAILFLPNLFSQKPIYPKPNLSNDILFNRKMPQALSDKINKANKSKDKSYPLNLINYQAHSASKVLVPGNTSTGANNNASANNMGSNNKDGNFHLTMDINTGTQGSFRMPTTSTTLFLLIQ